MPTGSLPPHAAALTRRTHDCTPTHAKHRGRRVRRQCSSQPLDKCIPQLPPYTMYLCQPRQAAWQARQTAVLQAKVRD